ncbi:MAG: pitrilysin family protein [Hyphomicrobiales bacterium]
MRILFERFVMSRIVTFVFAVLFVFVPLSAQAIDIKEIETDLGLKVLLVEDHTLPIITMSFAFRGGATQDEPEKSGALNLMSALLDEGAGPYDAEAFQNRLEDLATSISFNAGRDYLFGSMRTLSPHVGDAFEMLRLAIYEPHFNEKPLNRIRDQLLAGIRSEKNNPNALASKAMRELIYPVGHAYRRTVRGTETSVSSLNADDLRAIKKRVMGRDNLIISFVGDISPADLKKRLDVLFGDLPATADLRKMDVVEPMLGETTAIDIERPQTRFSFVGKGVARHDPDYIPAYLVNQILGGSGLTSRLSNEVREKRGLAYGISTGLSNSVLSSLFTGSVATRTDFADETFKVLKKELKRMADEGPTEEELALAKSYTIGVYALNFDGSSDIANTLTSLQIQNLPADYIKTRAKRINSVTLEQAKSAAKRLLGDDSYSFVRLGPAPK